MNLSRIPETITPTTAQIKWMRVPDAVRYSGMSRAKLYQLMAEGKIKTASVRQKGNLRGLRLFSVESIDAFLESFVES
jgi:Helix-turn-helix domain